MNGIFKHKMTGVCSRSVMFRIEDDAVKDIIFTGGCNGNLKALAKVLDGKKVDEIISSLEGITCGNKKTSCADQFAKVLKETKHEF